MSPPKPHSASHTHIEGHLISDNVACVPTRSAPNMGCNMLDGGGQEGKIRTTNGVDVHLVAF